MENPLTGFLDSLKEEGFNTYYQSDIGKGNYKPLFTPTPSPMAVPYRWDYKKAREKLYQLSEFLTPDVADRVNIQFENPGLSHILPAATTPTMRGGIQLLKPGQSAPTHKHTPNAFRFVLESDSEQSYTIVDGTKLPMKPGDLILTPNWTWHDHHNEGSSDTIWFDGLDLIFVYWMGGIFYSTMGGKRQKIVRDHQVNTGANGNGVIPTVGNDEENGQLLYYSFESVNETLSRLMAQNEKQDMFQVRYINPANGKDVFPTMALKMTLVRPGQRTGLFRKTENVVYVTFSGTGKIRLADSSSQFELTNHDVVV